MIISEIDSSKIWKKISLTLAEKVKQKDSVDWNSQFDSFYRIIEAIEDSLHLISRYEIEKLRKSAGSHVIATKDEIDWSAYENTEQNMANLMGKIVGVAHFLSTHNSRVVSQGEKDFEMPGFAYYSQISPFEKSFHYEKELVAMERYLTLIKIGYQRNLQQEGM